MRFTKYGILLNIGFQTNLQLEFAIHFQDFPFIFSSLASIFCRIFATEWMLKNLKVPPFYSFRYIRFF